jgi:hypothetical protein
MWTKLARTLPSAIALLASVAGGAFAAESIDAILANPGAFDGKHVVVTGTAAVEPKTSRRGNEYETFQLCDRACVHVFTWGHPSITEGQPITVRGTFAAVKHVGQYEFKNEIDAEDGSLK